MNTNRLCNYLINVYLKSGINGIKKYQKYLEKEMSKKKVTLEELSSLKERFDYSKKWVLDIMPTLDFDAIREQRASKKLQKQQSFIQYLYNQVFNFKLNINDIKSEYYRNQVIDMIAKDF